MIVKNETKLDEMINILEILHKYVPTNKTTHDLQLLLGEPYSFKLHSFHSLLFEGDQLIADRICGVQRLHSNLNDGTARLEGLVSLVEDWHARIVFPQVSA